MEKINNTVFLDFDGVLIPKLFSAFGKQINKFSKGDISNKDEYGEFFSPSSIHNLRLLIFETDASIVFTSNWRKDKHEGGIGKLPIREMWERRYGFGQVIGSTPVLDPTVYNRGDEIALWLSHTPSSNYLILDDMGPTMFLKEQLPYLVTCSEEYGFTNSDLQKALKILR